MILGMVAFAACNDIENCDANDELDFMIVRFFDKETRAAKQMGYTITADNSPFSFVPFTDSTGVGLPLNPDTESTTFFFDSAGTDVHEELVISYETQVSIFDPDCDPSFTFTALDTVRYTFDSLSIPGRITNRQLSTNVAIYF